MITILHEQREVRLPDAKASGDSLWLNRDSIEDAVGWNWKPEGLCQGEVCIPLPTTRSAELVHDGLLDIAGMWQHMQRPVARDDSGQTWVLGTGAAERTSTLATTEAPDFVLPDLAGKQHRLSDYRGKKVFLATWASW